MTQTEIQILKSLPFEVQLELSTKSDKEKKDYLFYHQGHPEWSHENILKRMALDIVMTDVFVKGKKPIDINDPVFLKEMLEKSDGWLNRNFPTSYEKIRPYYRAAIVKIDGYIQKGIKFIQDAIEFIQNIFN